MILVKSSGKTSHLTHLPHLPLIIEALENKFGKKDNSMPHRFLTEISPAGFQFLQVSLGEELLIMEMLLFFAPQYQLDKLGAALDYTLYLSREKPASMI